jgi:endonuclease/exonuclease/phosphatase family metal-dependent hydrolase
LGGGGADKSNGVVNLKWCGEFNEWIHKHSLMEIKLVERCFTWSNNQENAIMTHIDRVFYDTDFDMKFPLSSAKALHRQLSDHTPIMWESGVGQKIDKPRFKFEKW